MCIRDRPTNEELSKLPRYIQDAAEAGVDAFIIADLGVLALAKKYAPQVERHVSTQAGITNYEACLLYTSESPNSYGGRHQVQSTGFGSGYGRSRKMCIRDRPTALTPCGTFRCFARRRSAPPAALS